VNYLEINGVNKSFGGFRASDDIFFSVGKGALAGLLGPSGSGKTTILRMIAGLETPDSGDILIDGALVNDIPASERGIGFVFQNYALFRYMKVKDNIAFGLSVQKKDKKYIRNRVSELTEIMGLSGLENRYPRQLSGGQRQRVAFARAVAPNPRLLLLDEPFAAIDAKVRKELRGWLRRMIKELNVTGIFVTHDQDEAIEVADEIVIINKGRVEQTGSPSEIYKKPATPFVAEFIGRSTVVENYGRFTGFTKFAGYERAALRPEFVRVSKKDRETWPNAASEGVVEDVFFRGDTLELQIDVNGAPVTTVCQLDDENISRGETVSVVVRRLLLLGENDVRIVENEALDDKNPIYI
jgi:sulfate transport system ATP-binding protein